MATTVIPMKYQHKCDICEKAVEEFTEVRPAHWARLILEQHAYDGDCAVADATVEYLLCRACTKTATEAIIKILSTKGRAA